MTSTGTCSKCKQQNEILICLNCSSDKNEVDMQSTNGDHASDLDVKQVDMTSKDYYFDS